MQMSMISHPLLPPTEKNTLAVNQLEHIVIDEIAAGAVGQELEHLGVVHGAFLFINLEEKVSDEVCKTSRPLPVVCIWLEAAASREATAEGGRAWVPRERL